jgi:hypothetical protein
MKETAVSTDAMELALAMLQTERATSDEIHKANDQLPPVICYRDPADVRTIRKPTLRLGILNAARSGSELTIQVSDDLFVVRFRPAIVVSDTRVVISDDLPVVRLRPTVVVVDSPLVSAVDSVNFAIDLLLCPTLGFAQSAVEFINIETCHDLAPYRNRTSLCIMYPRWF